MSESPTRQPNRKWYCLHRSTLMLLVMFAGAYSLIAIPGSVEHTSDETWRWVQFSPSRSPSIYSLGYQHGWPFVHWNRLVVVDEELRIQGEVPAPSLPPRWLGSRQWDKLAREFTELKPGELEFSSNRFVGFENPFDMGLPSWTRGSSWSYLGLHSSFSIPGMLGNMAVFIALGILVAIVLEMRRRRVAEFFQFGLRQMLVVFVVIALGCGLYTQARHKQVKTARVVKELDALGLRTQFINKAPVWWTKVFGRRGAKIFEWPTAVRSDSSFLVGLDDQEISQLAQKINFLDRLKTLTLINTFDRNKQLLKQLDFEGHLVISLPNWKTDDWKEIEELKCEKLTLGKINKELGNSFLLSVAKSSIEELELNYVNFEPTIDWRTLKNSRIRRIRLANCGRNHLISSIQVESLQNAGIVVTQE